MKNLCLLLVGFLLCFGCSKSDEETKRETLGKELSNRMKAPMEKTRSITDKIGKMRAAESPE